MKKIFIFCMGLLSWSYALSQEIGIEEALRFSMEDIKGTARFRGMSGAFGALGGDMSATNINPAGSAIFNMSHASVSLGVVDNASEISYFNAANSYSNTRLDLNQFGATFVFGNVNSASDWTKFTLSFAYDKTADFNQDWVSNGINPNTSIATYFETYANGLRLDEISALQNESISEAYAEIGTVHGFRHQQAFLGYEGYIIDPENDTDDNTAYTSNVSGADFNQRYIYSSRGYNGKAAFNFSTSYLDKIYLGLNLNVHFIDFDKSTLLNERNNNLTSPVANINFENNIRTFGSGFSFQLGTIVKLTDAFRVGLSYKSPTWHRMSDETSQAVSSQRIVDGSNLTQIVNPNVINIYDEYRLQSPSEVTGSFAYVFGKKGLLSLDYGLKDYSNTRFRPTTDLIFSDLNNEINNTLDTSVSVRLGGEYRYKQMSFRGGYRFEESPYINDDTIGNLNGYSLGLGYSFGDFNLDIAFSQSRRNINYQLYSVGLTDSALVESSLTDVILTLGFNL